MEGNRFTFCPQCGGKNIETQMGGRKWQCPDCGFDLYNNVASAVGVIITNDNGEVLFEKRAKEPRKGFYVVPGGFVDADETGEQAAIRECEEETGVRPQQVRYLCSFPNTYEYKGIVYKTCDMFFTARLPRGIALCAQESEVAGFMWIPVHSVSDIEKIPLAFESARKTLLTWLEVKQNEN
jgi:NADH pyrophosphatase NudC (nudix superfamily)